MSLDNPVSSTRPASTAGATTEPVAPFEERWAAWQARGAAHDRAVRRKMKIGAPILVVVAAVLYAAFAL